jgi:hypothetical protein
VWIPRKCICDAEQRRIFETVPNGSVIVSGGV